MTSPGTARDETQRRHPRDRIRTFAGWLLDAPVAAGNGLGEMATAFARGADSEGGRPRWLKRLSFTGSAVLIAALLIVAFTFNVWGGGLLDAVAARYGLRWYWVSGWQDLEGLFILLLVVVGATLLYYMAGSGRYCFWQTAPGAAISTLFWLLLIEGFQLSLSIANPGSAYGAANSILVFVVFLHVSSMGPIVGAMSAAVIARESRKPKEQRAGARSPAPPAMRARWEQGGRG